MIFLSTENSSNSIAETLLVRNDYAIVTSAEISSAQGASPVSLALAASTNISTIDFTDSLKYSKWSPYLETVFQDLVERRANGKITPEEKIKLSRIRMERQRLKNPLSSKVMLRDFKSQQLRRKALEALKEYVEFLETTSRSAKA
jgi:hypothetical protein